MCNTCGCNITEGNRAEVLAESADNGLTTLTVLSRLTARNDRQAGHNRQHFQQHQVLAVNLMSSPGSGKTSLLEATIKAWAGKFRLAVIEGDLATENDAKRIRNLGVPAHQITTGSACHLDAHLLHNALHHLDLSALDIVFIENVGNLVCPASFDLGHHLNVVLLSVTEGDDKPAKYPVMFRAADLMLVTKTDLSPYLPDFDIKRATGYLQQLTNTAPLLPVSAVTGSGLGEWLNWLEQQRESYLERLELEESTMPRIVGRLNFQPGPGSEVSQFAPFL